jgi:hypothetical protein
VNTTVERISPKVIFCGRVTNNSIGPTAEFLKALYAETGIPVSAALTIDAPTKCADECDAESACVS